MLPKKTEEFSRSEIEVVMVMLEGRRQEAGGRR
jgi:hypothetical protein